MNKISKYKTWKYSKFLSNKNFYFNREYVLSFVPKKLLHNSYKTISSWKNYKITPLLQLNKLSKDLELKNIFYKDESKRFNLKSFKALGGAYAVAKVTQGKKGIVISSATAGNHGRSVAWGAQRLGLKCNIFVSEFVSDTRVKEIEKYVAKVVIV